MPKMKTNSGAAKRFKKTASGKIKRKHAFKNHILTKKSKKRKKRLSKDAIITDADMPRIKLMLPND
jgi:large subunit ribosomal protein L35